MINRIKKLMDAKKLSATQFSDEIEIQRSSLSHVLSGRNKPSLDFMLKIKNTYPEIELDWLLMGKGKMVKEFDESSEIIRSDKPKINIEPEINFQNDEEQLQFSDEEKMKKVASSNIIGKISGKHPVRVLLFYEDNTFESFQLGQ